MPITHFAFTRDRATRRIALMLVACGIAAWSLPNAAHAGDVYRCAGPRGAIAFQDTPCGGHASQHKIDVQPLPTIGNPAEVAARARTAARHPARSKRRARTTRPARRRAPAKVKTSWECRADDGEVFYRHARCPGSIRGDGTVRSAYAQQMSSRHTRSRQDAWSRVRVHGKKIPRSEACRRIHAAGAAGRDGHLRDATVATYDHLMGRDPCDGA